MKKEKLLLILSDLDNTIFPIGANKISDFSQALSEVVDNENVKIKFCPVTGRTANSVLTVMEIFDISFRETGIDNVVGYGAAEYGGVILSSLENSFNRVFLCDKMYEEILTGIKKDVSNGKFGKYFNVADEGRFIAAFYLKDSYRDISEKNKHKYVYCFKNYLNEKYGKNFEIWGEDILEIKPKEISKEKAIRWILDRYQKEYDIRGIVYCGDSENDKNAIEYLSRIGTIPGIKVNVFLPSNAKDEIKSENIEAWKDRLRMLGVQKNIKVSKYKLSVGITDLLRKSSKNGELLERRPRISIVKDDFEVRYSI